MSGEKEFKRWIVSNAPNDWLIQTIETATGSGVPDLFICINGNQGWAELKSTDSTRCYMRISQWRWFCKLISRGGSGLLLIKRLKRRCVDVYDARPLTRLSAGRDCVLRGDDIIFPSTIKPVVSYKLGTGGGEFYKNILEVLKCTK